MTPAQEWDALCGELQAARAVGWRRRREGFADGMLVPGAEEGINAAAAQEAEIKQRMDGFLQRHRR